MRKETKPAGSHSATSAAHNQKAASFSVGIVQQDNEALQGGHAPYYKAHKPLEDTVPFETTKV